MSLLATYTGSPASIADASDLTYLEAVADNPDPHAVVEDLPLAIGGTLTGSPGSGAIGFVVFRPRASKVLIGDASSTREAVAWTLDGITDTSDITLTQSAADYASEPQFQRPGGGAWQWSDFPSLADVGVSSVVNLLPVSTAKLRLAELALDVYGPEGIEGDVLAGDAAGDLPAGSVEGDLSAASSVNDLPAGSSTGDLLIEAPAADMEAT